jgi:hypothetical protein
MPNVRESVASLVSALLGVSTFSPPTQPGPKIGDEGVRLAREALGGNLEPIPQTRLRWYPPDVERAQLMADNGDMTLIGQLNQSMRVDGVVRGLLDARACVVNFPKRFYGAAEVVDTLKSKTNSDRDVYNEMIPAAEAKLMVADEIVCGLAIGEMVPVKGRNFPVLIRRFVQNLYYLWPKNQWYYRSIAGLIPIQPGVPTDDGNMWVLHMGGGRLAPWNSGRWNTLGRSYINKTQTLFARQSYVMKHSHPARVAFSSLGASDEQRRTYLTQLIRWALNAAFVLDPGWDVKLIESNGQGIKVYDADIENYDKQIATALCGSSAMLQGTAGFSNLDVFRVVQTDLITESSSAWDHTVNTQILPAFIGQHWGVDALDNATTVETDTTPPKDRKIEADTLVQLGAALKGLAEAIARAQVAAGSTKPVAVNVVELLERFGVPFSETGVDPREILASIAANDEPQQSRASEAA